MSLTRDELAEAANHGCVAAVMVSRELLREAAQLWRWAEAQPGCEHFAARKLAAQLKARAAFRLTGSNKEFRS